MILTITSEDRNLEFDPGTYQQSNYFQYISKKFSIWCCMDKYYTAKYDYYVVGNSKLTDQEFDSLERSIIALAGEDFIKKFGGVGYDVNIHKLVKNVFSYFKNESYVRFTMPWNKYVEKLNSGVKLIKEIKEIKEIIKLPDPVFSDSGQCLMVF